MNNLKKGLLGTAVVATGITLFYKAYEYFNNDYITVRFVKTTESKTSDNYFKNYIDFRDELKSTLPPTMYANVELIQYGQGPSNIMFPLTNENLASLTTYLSLKGLNIKGIQSMGFSLFSTPQVLHSIGYKYNYINPGMKKKIYYTEESKTETSKFAFSYTTPAGRFNMYSDFI